MKEGKRFIRGVIGSVARYEYVLGIINDGIMECDWINDQYLFICFYSIQYQFNKFAFYLGSVQPRLIFANRYDIRSFGINGSDYRLVAGGLKGIVGLDFDYSTNYVYWTDVHHEILQRARIDRYNSTELLLRDLHTPDGLSVDWIGRKLYWTDTGLKKIEVSELDGTNNMDLVSVSEHGQPRAIACDPNEG